MQPSSFPPCGWGNRFTAQALLAEFGASGWQASITLDPPPRDAAELASEIDVLLSMAQLRPGRMADILAQAEDATPYWADLLMATPVSHPATWDLIYTGEAVAQMVAMHFKRLHNRPRPVQYYPALMPPIQTPPHASYPNAHALQSYVINGCLVQACPDLAAPLGQLARDIAENREVAGLHFPTDTIASGKLAPQVVNFLGMGARFLEVLAAAKAEWPAAAIPFPVSQ